jgi:hypothetical protein
MTVVLLAVLYAWMRLPSAEGLRQPLLRFCERLDMPPSDWPCRVSHAQAVASYVGGSVLIWAALALPGVILAAAGPRLSALLPAMAAAACIPAGTAMSWLTQTEPIHSFFGLVPAGGTSSTLWGRQGTAAILLDLALVCLPAALVVEARRFADVRDARPQRVRPRAAAGAALWCAAPLIAVLYVGARLGLLTGNEWSPMPALDTAVAVVAMIAFGALLGTDRRWWPWSIAPAAVLLSLGLPTALFGLPGRLASFGRFRAALPLACVGLVASSWRVVAGRLDPRPDRPVDEASVRPTLRPAALAALNGLAAGLLAVAGLAAALDPLPARIDTVIPTYQALRSEALDVLTRLDLRAGIQAMDAYRAATGTYAGFSPSVAPDVTRAIGLVNGQPSGVRQVGVTESADDLAEVVATSESGTAFCLRSSVSPEGVSLTYGAGPDLAAARARCSSIAWSASAVRFPPYRTMCQDADDQVLVTCRAVQNMLRTWSIGLTGTP